MELLRVASLSQGDFNISNGLITLNRIEKMREKLLGNTEIMPRQCVPIKNNRIATCTTIVRLKCNIIELRYHKFHELYYYSNIFLNNTGY